MSVGMLPLGAPSYRVRGLLPWDRHIEEAMYRWCGQCLFFQASLSRHRYVSEPIWDFPLASWTLLSDFMWKVMLIEIFSKFGFFEMKANRYISVLVISIYWPVLEDRAHPAQSLSHVQLFATPWTIACQASLFMGILQVRVLEWVAMLSYRGSSQPRDQIQVFCIAGQFFIVWAIKEAQGCWNQ